MGHLGERDRDLVIQLTGEGVSASRIALRLGCSIRTVRRVRARFRESGTWSRLPGSGARRKTSRRDDRHLFRLVRRHRKTSLNQLTTMFNERLPRPVTPFTVRSRLRAQGIHSRVAKRKPLIKTSIRTCVYMCYVLFTRGDRFNLREVYLHQKPDTF